MLMAVSSAPDAEVAAWQVDKSLSKVTFRVSSFGITAVSGIFRDFDLNVRYNSPDLTSISVEGAVHVASVETGSASRDADIRNQVFAAGRFPHMTFRSKRVENVRGTEATLVGELTIRDVTREVAFHLKQLEAAGGENHVAVKVWTTLHKKDLRHMVSGLAGGLGGLFGLEVQIIMELELAQAST